MKSTVRLSSAIEGYLLNAASRRLSPHTIADYTNSFRKFQAWLVKDPPLDAITSQTIEAFLASLTRTPAGARPIGGKQALNIHTGLSALWTWAVKQDLCSANVVRVTSRPKPPKPAISPFTQQDIEALLSCCDRTAAYVRPGMRVCDNERCTGLRDRAIILLLLDTGIRASELCELTLRQLDLKNQRVSIWGKGAKQRHLPLGPTTARILWRYIADKRSDAGDNETVFLGKFGDPLDRKALFKLLQRLGERAGVKDCHPHRFRHTFAIAYLRNGGNAIALQASLGHETLEMVRVYTQIAAADLDMAHRTASPVENWRL